ncbi:expressed protein [Phakopsora pachyrhizi]|uniref:Expressed protein n=1 Tax=Phakopsora pachyrhizi TaxID=170000 RepID=A0AAV0B6Y2_PHAPC|nr:expressed protein [Phakopsora pachyrhizi]
MYTTTATAQETVSLLVSPRVIRPQPRPIRVSPRLSHLSSVSPQLPDAPSEAPHPLNRSKRRKGKLKNSPQQAAHSLSQPVPTPKRPSPSPDSERGDSDDLSAIVTGSPDGSETPAHHQLCSRRAHLPPAPRPRHSNSGKESVSSPVIAHISLDPEHLHHSEAILHSTFTFSKNPLPVNPSFDFPSPTVSRHQPPPHPGPVLRSSLHHSARSPPRISQSPVSPISYFSKSRRGLKTPYHGLYLTFHPSKRSLSWTSPSTYHSRTKKRKLRHLSYRSSLIMYPAEHWMRPRVSPIPSSSTSFPPDCSPKWLTSSSSPAGHTSSLCPKEEQWTGTGDGWQTNQFSLHSRNFRSLSHSPLNSPLGYEQSTSRHASHHWMPSTTQSQVAPLKAQLLAILRLRSNAGPGEASLRFKKWVIWNSWVRKEHPMIQTYNHNSGVSCTGFGPPSNSQRIQGSTSSWTGDEVFDENGDLVCSDEEGEQLEEAEIDNITDEESSSSPEEEEIYNYSDTENKETNKETKIRIRLQPTSLTFLHPTPPASPTSADSQLVDSWRDQSNQDECLKINDSLPLITSTHRPPTPPPSPPSETR